MPLSETALDARMDAEIDALAAAMETAKETAAAAGFGEDAFARACMGEICAFLFERGHGDLVSPLSRLLCDALVPDEWVEPEGRD